ncbi:MAG: hypothetical protein M3Y54_01565 [Bacteroidota bacterium]|nr:hypothetical protein [Bacteroidota bacterium]
MNKPVKPILLTLTLLLLTGGLAFAQAPADGGPAPTSPTSIPIDGGASLLLAGGLAFGLKQLRARRLARRARQ